MDKSEMTEPERKPVPLAPLVLLFFGILIAGMILSSIVNGTSP